MVVFPGTTPKSTKRPHTRRPPTTNRTVEVVNCDDQDNVRAVDEETLIGKIVVKSCPCEKRFKKDASRLKALSVVVTKKLRAYFQNVYRTEINYDVKVQVLSGNKTFTVFSYTVKVPKPEQARTKTALNEVCKDKEVSGVEVTDPHGRRHRSSYGELVETGCIDVRIVISHIAVREGTGSGFVLLKPRKDQISRSGKSG
jgi:hypothetical protein